MDNVDGNKLENRRQIRDAITVLVAHERYKQIVRQGFDEDNTGNDFIAYAMEELGETVRAYLEGDPKGLQEELVQTIAVLTAWLEKIMEGDDSDV